MHSQKVFVPGVHHVLNKVNAEDDAAAANEEVRTNLGSIIYSFYTRNLQLQLNKLARFKILKLSLYGFTNKIWTLRIMSTYLWPNL